MNFSDLESDAAILDEMGRRLLRKRLDMRLTQAELAVHAGVSKRTVERLEGGGSVQMVNWIRVMRALELVGGLEQLLPHVGPSPMALLRSQGKERKRVRHRAGPMLVKEQQQPWTWGDES